MQLVVVDVHQVLEGPPLYPVEGHRGYAMALLKVYLQTEFCAVTVSAVRAGEIRLMLRMHRAVDQALVDSPADLRVEHSVASWVTTLEAHGPRPTRIIQG